GAAGAARARARLRAPGHGEDAALLVGAAGRHARGAGGAAGARQGGNGVMSLPLLRSPIIPAAFRHGFTTRAGGVSAPPFDSLNLGGRWGDAPDAVAENRRRVADAAGAPLYFATQVHGADIVRVRAGDAPAD